MRSRAVCLPFFRWFPTARSLPVWAAVRRSSNAAMRSAVVRGTLLLADCGSVVWLMGHTLRRLHAR